ncbi:MFS transporter [Caldisphaera sp.]|uniref:MFS transporter n=1 Tax=Caldisphaera sp. TaxID=2060322 RepID=UPI0025C2514D|nr:MFS transporter [Caldisphaera sp.]
MNIGFARILMSKSIRVFLSGIVSILTPFYLKYLGFSPFLIGISIFVIVLGNVVQNLILTWFRSKINIKTYLLIVSLLFSISGFILFISSSIFLIFLSLFIGNISTTGTETGPFQSIEAGILPDLVDKSFVNRAYGIYNFLGYTFSSLGALTSSIPAYFNYDIFSFKIFYLLYGIGGLIIFINYVKFNYKEDKSTRLSLKDFDKKAKRDLYLITALFSTDALGGGFIVQSIVAYWFNLRYGISLKILGPLFTAVNIITAISLLLAPLIAERLGNLRTMVITHLISNVFLIMIPIFSSFWISAMFLLLRQSMSQMDVPTRQAFIVEIFKREYRVSFNSISNTFRSISSLFGSPLDGIALENGLLILPFFAGGFIKIFYDISIFYFYHNRTK